MSSEVRKPLLVGMNRAAEEVGVSLWTLRRLADRGELRTVYIGSRRLVPVEELDRLAKGK